MAFLLSILTYVRCFKNKLFIFPLFWLKTTLNLVCIYNLYEMWMLLM